MSEIIVRYFIVILMNQMTGVQMQGYVIASLVLFLNLTLPVALASTLCNEDSLDLSTTMVTTHQLPLNAVVRIASPLKSVQRAPHFPYYGHGSGVLISVKGESGFVLSASHVTAGHPLILVSINSPEQGSRILWAKLVKEDKKQFKSAKSVKYVKRDAVKKIIAAWVITVPAAAVLSAVVFFMIKGIMS